MTEQLFRQTPLFQLNLLIWLSMPAKGGQIKPIFQENGFEIYAIGAAILVPIAARLRASRLAGQISIANSVSPDLLLQSKSQRALLTIECKLNSFGSTSDSTQQALGILACTGNYVANFFGLSRPDQWTTLATYAVAHPQQTLMSQTLAILSEQLKTVDVAPCPATSFGIEVGDDGVYLNFSDLDLVPLKVASKHKVMNLEVGEDPRPLYLIPLDPTVNAQDEYGKRVVQERLRMAFASVVASRLYLDGFSVTWDELMTEAIQVWPLWKDRSASRNLLGQTKNYVQRILSEIGRLDVIAERTANGFSLKGIKASSAQQIRKFLMGVAYRQGELDLWQEGVQLGFEEVGEWKVGDSQG